MLDGTLRAKEQKKFEALIESASSKAPGKMAVLPVHPHVFATLHRRAPALAAPDHRVRAALRRRVDERAGHRLGACSLQGVHKYELYLVQLKF